MSFPLDPLDIEVQALFGGVWTDLVSTAEVLGAGNRLVGDIRVTQARSDEDGKATPGSAQMVLWNDDGWLTPDNPSPDNPWFDQWKRGCQLRVKVQGTVVFWGEVSEVDVEWPEGDLSEGGTPILDEDGDPILDEDEEPLIDEISDLGISFVNVTASGLLRRLGQGQKPLRSPIHRLATNPTNLPDITDYFPMEDGGASAFSLSGLPNSSKQMELVNVRFAADDTLGGSEPLPSVSSGQDAYWMAPVRGPSGEWRVEQFFRIPSNVADATQRVVLMDLKTTGTVARYILDLYFDGAPIIRWRAFNQAGQQIDADTIPVVDVPLAGDEWVKVRMAALQDGGDVIHECSWSPVREGDRPITGIVTSLAGTAGRPRLVRGEISNAPAGGVSTGHLIVSGDRSVNWLFPADIGHVGEKAMWRYIRLSNELGFVAGVSGDPEDTAPMGRQTAQTFLALLEECSEADNAILAEIRSLFGLVFRARRALYNQTPALVLDARSNHIANPFRPVTDDQGYRNDVTVRQIGGATARKFDEWAVEQDDGVYDAQFDLSLYDPEDAVHHAGWRLHTGVTRATRYPQVTIDFGVAPVLIAWWLDRSVGHRIGIENLPPQHPLFGVQLIIQGWTEILSPFGWMVTINCSPARPWNVACWYQTRYTAGSAEITGDIDATETTFEVESSVRWIQSGVDPEKFPFDIQLGPERMTVTAVVGSGTTQDFTVIRNVNGMARAHDAGTTLYAINEAVDIPQPVGPVMAL